MSMSLLAKSESTRKFKTGCCCFPWPKRRPRDEGRHPPLRPSFEIESGLQLQHLQDHASQPISHGGVLQEASPPPAVALRIPHPLEDPPGTPQPPLQPPILQDNSTQPPRAGVALGYSISSFTYEELSVATNGFSADNFLGKGGFGLVHKGVLPNGKEVAVKQLKAGSLQGEREFRAEVEVISRVHHKHLVSLVGYCISASQMMVVYDFVPNNTLEFHLHGQETIDWPKRQRIALGSAKGLAYLHEDCHSKIVHRDIKASNILLNSNFEAKVADFGLAKCLSDSETHVSTRVMGTKGYLDPEYASSGKLTNKSDVFSFGVVLLELITGHQPLGLVDQARRFLTRALEQNNFDALVDPKLQNDYDLTEMTRMVTCAAACVHRSARRRPLMSQIVRGLEGDVDALSKLSKGVRPNTQIEKMASGSEESGASSSWESSASNQARAYASDLHGSSRKGKTIRGVGLPTVEESGASLSGEFGASNQVRAQASDLPGSSRKDKTIRGVGLPKVEEYGASNQARAQDSDLPGSSTEGKTEEDLPTGWDRVPESGASSSGESGAIKLGLGTSQ